jgi:nucleoside-diphosphate-sugar epimerase
MKIMVTGATGYVGRHVVKLLLSHGHSVASIERSPKRTPESVTSFVMSNEFESDLIKEAFGSFSPDLVIHLAAKWSTNSSSDSLDQYVNANVNLPKQVITEAISMGARFLNICSYWQLDNFISKKTGNPYVTTKNAFRSFAEELRLLHKGRISNVYLFDNYGPHDSRGKVISTIVENAQNRMPTKLRSPNVELNLLHIEDVARGIADLVGVEELEPNYEVSNFFNITLAGCVKTIELAFNHNIDVTWLEDTTMQQKNESSHARLFPLPHGWKPRIDLIEGVRMLKDAP